ncbi:MAG: hypothetical protein JNM27_05685 [Leptospirales bacterium]|nr:hypothetical protein [Leptospirales bacterium]
MSTFSIQRADGATRAITGYRKGTIDPGAKRYGAKRYQSSQLPPKVDLRPKFTDIEAQGNTNSCTANAVAGAYEYVLKNHLGDDAYDVSRLFVYYNARELDENYRPIEDSGSMIGLAVKGLAEYGVCSEETWPFEESEVNSEPPEEAYEEAKKFLIEEYAVVPTDLFSWKHCLAEGYPIVFGLELYNSFDHHRKPGLVPEPTSTEVSREEHAGHAMVCVGYSDKDQVFIVRNSWGTNWGDNGYCYIPYKYVMNSKYNDGDSWYIRRVDELKLTEALWGDDTSVTGSYETELSNMSDEAYQAMLEDMGRLPLETRIAMILYNAAAMDGEVSEDEIDSIATYMDETLDSLGSDLEAGKVLRVARKMAENEELVEESVKLLGKHLSNEMLATIANDVQQVIGTDDITDEEQEMLDWLNSEWQIEESE